MGESRIAGRCSCAVIGAGNVASSLAPELSRYLDVRQIYSRDITNARALASAIDGCEAISSLDALSSDIDFYLISVRDDAVANVVRATESIKQGLWAHTSGSVPADILSGKEFYGVFYPLQTFSKGKSVNLREVPFFIEGNDEKSLNRLMKLAAFVSDKVYEADSDRRKKLHVAAVFACNFANLMWIEADRLLKDEGLAIDVFYPLLRETLSKLDKMSPLMAQTGPARRGDVGVIKKHLSMLDGDKAEIYKLLSENILKIYNE